MLNSVWAGFSSEIIFSSPFFKAGPLRLGQVDDDGKPVCQRQEGVFRRLDGIPAGRPAEDGVVAESEATDRRPQEKAVNP